MTWQWSMNMIKVKLCRFEPHLGRFTILIVDGSSEIGLFRHLSNYVLRVRNFENTKDVRVIFFFKMFKIKFRFQIFSKKCRKFFCFWDICVCIGIVKLSLLRAGYFSSDATVLTSCPKIFRFNKKDFFQLNWLSSDHWIL